MKTHWKKLTNPNYLGAYSIEDGRDLVLTIKYVKEEQVIGTDGKKDDCVVAYFYENKPMILNATNMKAITKLFGTPYIEEWIGKRIQVGVEKVRAFGDIVEALRVRKTLPGAVNEKPKSVVKCMDCGRPIQPVKGFSSSEQLAAYTENKYGRAMCSECAAKTAEKIKQEQAQSEKEEVVQELTEEEETENADQ